MEEDENNIHNEKTERLYTQKLIKTSKEMLMIYFRFNTRINEFR